MDIKLIPIKKVLEQLQHRCLYHLVPPETLVHEEGDRKIFITVLERMQMSLVRHQQQITVVYIVVITLLTPSDTLRKQNETVWS